MPSLAFDSSSLFATEHGTVAWASDEAVTVTLDERRWTVGVGELHKVHRAVESLAAQVYRCDCDCRWQVRMAGRRTFVVSTDELLQLHSLLDGAVAMLELDGLLNAAEIEWAGDA